jgi:hypothetical protein
VIDGRTRARCRRCEQLLDVSCAECGAAPRPERLTDVAAAASCDVCEAPLSLLAAPAVDAADVVPEDEVSWGELVLDESGGLTPYRGGRHATRLRLSRPRGGLRHAALAWGVLSAPALVPAAVGPWWFGAAWASGVALFLAARSPVVALHVTTDELRVVRAGWRGGALALDAADVRGLFWSGRGAVCHLWARTASDDAPRLLFDGLTPDQARALELKVARVLELDAR